MATCPNESHPDFIALVEKLGSKELAYAAWNRLNKDDLPIIDSSIIEAQIRLNQLRVMGKTEDEKHYIIDGDLYQRLTNILPSSFDGDSSLHENSRTAGNMVDSIIRNFFNDGDVTIPEGISKDAHDAIIDSLTKIKEIIDAKGEKFIANNIIIFDENLKIASELDILSIDENGIFHNYDIKTSTERGWDNYTVPFKKGLISKKQSHINQLSAHSNLFYNQYRVRFGSLKIIPYQLTYDNRGFIETAKKLNDKTLIYDPKIESIIPTTDHSYEGDEVDTSILSLYPKQTRALVRRVKSILKEIKNLDKSSDLYIVRHDEALQLQKQLDLFSETPLKETLTALGRDAINTAMEFLIKMEAKGVTDISDINLNYIAEVINTWIEYTDLRDFAAELQAEFRKTIKINLVNKGNEYNVTKHVTTIEDFDTEMDDIDFWTGGTGSLADSRNVFAKTVGLTIRHSQNKIDIKNRVDSERITKEVDALEEYAKNSNMTMKHAYSLMTQERRGTTELIREFTDQGKENPKWAILQSKPEILRFYKFFQEINEQKQEESVYQNGGKYFIPNLTHDEAKTSLKRLSPLKTRKVGAGFEEDLGLDLVPLRYNKKLSPDEKSNDLGTALLAYSLHVNEYSEMSNILPGLRLIMEYMKFNVKGDTSQRQFRSSSNPNELINAKETNLWKMMTTVINMQVRGEMKAKEGVYVYGTTITMNGDIAQKLEKIVDLRQLGDNLLKYNSLLRIGFSPISASANILFGDISNTIEAIGGRFITYRGLLQASRLFISQIWDEKSSLHTVIKELNYLQELNDWAYLSEVKRTGKYRGLSSEKIQEYAYYMQKSGENWIQSRMAMGIMIKDGYLDGDTGELTAKYKNADLNEKQKLTDKIQRVNHMNHGRYTTKEAGAWQQNILFRMIFQFRKYIPAAIESRMGKYNPYDTRLQTDTEGRYRTIGRLFFSKVLTEPKQAFENLLLPILSYQKALAKGNLKEYEIYNMRKNIAEIILAIASFVIYIGIRKMGDDDEVKERLKNPVVKSTLLMLDRISGDLTYFYNPLNVSNLIQNIAPVNRLLVDLQKTVKYAAKGYPFYVGDWEYQSGSNEGKNKFYKTAKQVIILAKPLQEVGRIMSDKALEEQK